MMTRNLAPFLHTIYYILAHYEEGGANRRKTQKSWKKLLFLSYREKAEACSKRSGGVNFSDLILSEKVL